MKKPYYISKDGNFTLYKGDCIKLLPKLENEVDLVFADPPYFLSSNGSTIKNGKIVSVNKAEWDKSKEYNQILEFNLNWLKAVKDTMKNDATIWISGTNHNIFTIMQAIKELDFKLLNVIVWQKTNPPPNFYTKIFKQSVEYIVFARKSKKHTHKFNYELLKEINGGKRMTDVWTLPSIAKWEKSCGKHPTQKPINILSRIILSATEEGDTILDPLSGSSTTGIAANLLDRKYIGIEKETEFLRIARNRKKEILNKTIFNNYLTKIKDLQTEINFDNFNSYDL